MGLPIPESVSNDVEYRFLLVPVSATVANTGASVRGAGQPRQVGVEGSLGVTPVNVAGRVQVG